MKSISFFKLTSLFTLSRGGLCFVAIVIAIVLRVLLLQPITLLEILGCVIILFAWPQIEITIHWMMHNVKETELFNRHQLHHMHPDADTALGTLGTYIAYCLIPIPAYIAGSSVLSGMAITLLSALTIYEFIHFSNHQEYEPITSYGKKQRDYHFQHHATPKAKLAVIFPPNKPKESE
jgi:hypothetical protein